MRNLAKSHAPPVFIYLIFISSVTFTVRCKFRVRVLELGLGLRLDVGLGLGLIISTCAQISYCELLGNATYLS